jgi:hypothetical protein
MKETESHQYARVLEVIGDLADELGVINTEDFASALAYAAAGLGVLSKRPDRIRQVIIHAYDKAVREGS